MGSTLSTAHRLEIRRALYMPPYDNKRAIIQKGGWLHKTILPSYCYYNDYKVAKKSLTFFSMRAATSAHSALTNFSPVMLS